MHSFPKGWWIPRMCLVSFNRSPDEHILLSDTEIHQKNLTLKTHTQMQGKINPEYKEPYES